MPFSQGCFVQSLVEIGPVVLEKRRKCEMFTTDDDGQEQILIRIDNLILQIQSSIKFRSQPVISPPPNKKKMKLSTLKCFIWKLITQWRFLFWMLYLDLSDFSDCLLFIVLKNLSLIQRHHQCQWRAANFRHLFRHTTFDQWGSLSHHICCERKPHEIFWSHLKITLFCCLF